MLNYVEGVFCLVLSKVYKNNLINDKLIMQRVIKCLKLVQNLERESFL